MRRWGWPARLCLALGAGAAVALALSPALTMLAGSVYGEEGLSLAAYRDVLSTGRQWILMVRTLGLAAVAAAGSALLGFPLALALIRVDVPFRGLLVALTAVPVMAPPYVFAMAWIALLGDKGVVTKLFAGEGSAAPWSLYGFWGAALVCVVSQFPIVAGCSAAALVTADTAQWEAARLSVGWRRALTGIVIRQAMPGCLAGALLVFILTLGGYGVPSLLGVNVYSLEVYTLFNALYDMPGAAATALPITLCAAVLLLPFRKSAMRLARACMTARRRRPERFAIGQWRWIVFGGCLSVLGGSIACPLAALAWQAGGPRVYGEALATAWPELLHTAWVSIVAATLMVVLAVFSAYVAARSKRPWPALLDFAMLAALAVPGAVTGIGLIRIWNQPPPLDWVYGSSAILVLAASARFLGVAYIGASAALDRLDGSMEEASLLAGKGCWRTLFHVVLPQIRPNLAFVWLGAFLLSVAELDAAVLVCPAGCSTATVRLFGLMHYGLNESVAALALILAGATLLLGGVAWIGARTIASRAA